MNTPTLPDWARTWIARVIAALIAGVMTWFSRKGYDALVLGPEDQKKLTELTIIALTTLWGVFYGPIHKWINSRINSTDSASPTLAKAATAPFGEGERTALGEHMEAVAEEGAELETPPPFTDFADPSPFERRPIQPELVQRPREARPADQRTPDVIKAPPREKRKRAPKVVVQEPGAPQVASAETDTTPHGFEP